MQCLSFCLLLPCFCPLLAFATLLSRPINAVWKLCPRRIYCPLSFGIMCRMRVDHGDRHIACSVLHEVHELTFQQHTVVLYCLVLDPVVQKRWVVGGTKYRQTPSPRFTDDACECALPCLSPPPQLGCLVDQQYHQIKTTLSK